MRLTQEEVRHVAELAKLRLTDAEIDAVYAAAFRHSGLRRASARGGHKPRAAHALCVAAG